MTHLSPGDTVQEISTKKIPRSGDSSLKNYPAQEIPVTITITLNSPVPVSSGAQYWIMSASSPNKHNQKQGIYFVYPL